MASNYPPGVTGNEYAIGGAEREWEAIAECPSCGAIGYFIHEFHHEFGTRAFCNNPDCSRQQEGFEIDMSVEEEPDLWTEPENRESWGK